MFPVQSVTIDGQTVRPAYGTAQIKDGYGVGLPKWVKERKHGLVKEFFEDTVRLEYKKDHVFHSFWLNHAEVILNLNVH